MDNQRIERLHYYEENYEYDMPDKYFSVFVEIGMVKLILDDLPRYARQDTKSNLLMVLIYLATHKDCKSYILKYGGFEKAMEYSDDQDHIVKMRAL